MATTSSSSKEASRAIIVQQISALSARATLKDYRVAFDLPDESYLPGILMGITQIFDYFPDELLSACVQAARVKSGLPLHPAEMSPRESVAQTLFECNLVILLYEMARVYPASSFACTEFLLRLREIEYNY